jgi:hypothetical protein
LRLCVFARDILVAAIRIRFLTLFTHKKSPDTHTLRPGIPFLIPLLDAAPPHPRRTGQPYLSESRSSDFRIILLAAPSRPCEQWLDCGFRPRSRRRVRDGISPSSLSRPEGHSQFVALYIIMF